jgi:hypothetical protein
LSGEIEMRTIVTLIGYIGAFIIGSIAVLNMIAGVELSDIMSTIFWFI